MKLARLRQNINANQAASTPVRKTQLAYVDTAVKPPRGVARKQVHLLNIILSYGIMYEFNIINCVIPFELTC